MALFQKSVLKKYTGELNEDEVESAFERFVAFFKNPEIQENIRKSKEEQYQEGFLKDLFGEILGYTLNPNPGFNLTTELKNETGSKKADGAILKDGKAIGVIELKGTDTKDLDKINEQAFNYKNNHQGCVYVITSNFEKVRFFIENAVEYVEFNLFELSYEEFQLMYLCLYKDHLLEGLPQKIKNESLVKEEDITKELYKDYSGFKNDLWQNMCANQPKTDPLMLFKKSQKLIDRFLFIFFAEDSQLLPSNSITKIVNKWKDDRDWGDDKPLYDIFKQYFGFIHTGRPKSGSREEIFAYNGGLFEPDEILDNVAIDDDLLLKHTLKLTKYDFKSEVDVNILGHIFENSLNEIENITAELEGQEIDKSKSKRKKDGVFYTPKYITKYIVENTVGKLCEEKKAELNITDERFGEASKRSRKGLADLKAYRDWLLNLKICDPACGSGAFLNQALEFLMEEHRYLDELNAQYNKVPMVLSDIKTQILENNIYGVDINEESVEIAKLSLWLRTAEKGRKLRSLNNNIKCGNSLIDDPEVAGEKAFNWEKEFPQVFEKGGFDVVIGNPPYVRAELIIEFKKYLEKEFNSYHGNADLYIYFYELGLRLLKTSGILSYIAPNKWIQSKYGENLRVYIGKHFSLLRFIDFGEATIFEGVGTFPSISIIQKEKIKYILDYSEITDLKQIKNGDLYGLNSIVIESHVLEKNDWVLKNSGITNILSKLENNLGRFSTIFENKFLAGVKTGANSLLILNEDEVNRIVGDSYEIKLFKKIVFGKNIKKFELNDSLQYVFFPYEYLSGKQVLVNIEEYPRTYEYFKKHKSSLTKRAIIKEGVIKGSHKWYELQQINKVFDYNQPKIIYPDISIDNRFTLDLDGFIPDMTCFFIPNNNRAVLPILNSKMFKFLASNYCPVLGNISDGGRIRFKSNYLAQIPFPIFYAKESELVNLAEYSELKRKILSEKYNLFCTYLSQKFTSINLTNKLQSWYELDFIDFIKELNKTIKKAGGEKLSKLDEMEWMEVFEAKKKEALELKAEIDQTDREIDQMVYELYGLTEEEIAIVENADN